MFQSAANHMGAHMEQKLSITTLSIAGLAVAALSLIGPHPANADTRRDASPADAGSFAARSILAIRPVVEVPVAEAMELLSSVGRASEPPMVDWRSSFKRRLFNRVVPEPLSVDPAAVTRVSGVSNLTGLSSGSGVGTHTLRVTGTRETAFTKSPLLPFYVSFAALEVGDIVTTMTRVNGNAREANPIVDAVRESPAGLVALKAGGAAATLFLANRLAGSHPKAARVLMYTLNGIYGAVVMNNLR